jgi:hypothetical protein
MHRSNQRSRRNREINPALRIRDFYSFGLQVLNEINYARMHPDEFLEKLQELYNSVSDGNCLYVDGVPFLYTDLRTSLKVAIDFLSKQKPLPGLIYNKTITQACDYLLDELIIHDGLEDNEKSKYNLENRLSKFGQPLGECYELIDYGMFDPEFIVINFILCDGDNQKYERNVIFNPKIKYLGIASSILPSEKICTVINFCEEFFDKYEGIPIDTQMKYKKAVPQYNTKTNKSFLNQKDNSENNNNKYDNELYEDRNIEDIDDNIDDYDIKRRDSGKLYSMKRNQYIERRDSFKKSEEKNKNIPQRGGVINIPPKDNNINNIQENNNDEEDFFNNFKDDRKVLRKRKTLHEPKLMEVIEEEKDENEEPFDREFKIESSKKKPKIQFNNHQEKKISNFSKMPQDNTTTTNNNNTKVETKYEGNKKITTSTTTTTKTGKDGKHETVTTTITEEVDAEPPKFSNKFVKNIPFRSYGRKKYHDFNDDGFDIEKEMAELEKDFDKEFGHLNLKSPIKPVFDATDDMFENEDDIEMPEGAVNIEVKQKTITDSKGNPVLIVHKTITYENGEKKTTIEKKNLVKK